MEQIIIEIDQNLKGDKRKYVKHTGCKVYAQDN